jgi:hypothetical protein
MILRRRFSDVIARQLDVFAEDERHGMLAEVEELKTAYDGADRDRAEQAYGDYVDAVDAVKDALADMRDRYAQTLESPVADEYAATFERAARKRWRWLG